MKILRIFIVIAAAMCLCSCGGDEPNNIAYVVALGIDKAEDDNYDITVQFAKTNQISGGSSEDGGKTGSEIIQNITVEAPGIYSAINTANHIISKKFSMSHAKLVVFSKELAKEGVGELVNTIIRSDELRPDVFIAVAEDEAKKYLSEVKPVIEVNPAKYYQLVYGENKAGGVPTTNLQSFYFDKDSKQKNSVVPLAGVTKSEGGESDNPKNEAHKDAQINNGNFEYHVKNYRAGEVAVNSENKSEAMGMAVFDGDKMIGELGSIDAEIYNILSGDLEHSYISFQNRETGQAISAKLYKIKRPSYKIDIKNKKITVNLFLESDLNDKPYEGKDFNIDELEQDITDDINYACEEFIMRTRDELGCDVVGFGEKIKCKFLTNKKFNEYNFKDDFKNYDIKVETEFRVRRVGLKV